MSDFNVNDLINTPELECPEETRVIEARNRSWSFTMRGGAERSGEEFFALSSAFATDETASPVTVVAPPNIRVSVTDPQYITLLKVLSVCCVKPRLSVEQWALLGHKLGGKVIDDLGTWALSLNGLTEDRLNKDTEQAKNAESAEGSEG